MLAIVAPERCYVDNLLQKLTYKKMEAPSGAEVYQCEFDNHEFITAVTGYGKINIGSTLRYICEKYNIKVITCVGSSGSIVDTNDIFSFVIPNSTLEFDVDFMPNGYMPGQIPNVNKCVYNTNDDLNDCIFLACKKSMVNYTSDVIASSDMFVSNYNLANSIRREYNAGAVDCEAGSVGQFCYINNIPYACIKIISNYANNNAIKQYNLYDKESCATLNKVVYKFLKIFYKE